MVRNTEAKDIMAGIKKLRNRIIGSFLLLFVAFGTFAAQTYAYFWDTASSNQNKIEAGNLAIELLEIDSSEAEQAAHVSPVKFAPGTTVEKIVKIKNTGSLPVYVRVRIEKAVTNQGGEMPDGWEELIACNFNVDDPSTPGIREKLWLYHDGYYYYCTIIDPESITASLFDEVHFSEEMGNEFANADIELKVICQAVQANGNSDDPITAWGWPTESNTPSTNNEN